MIINPDLSIYRARVAESGRRIFLPPSLLTVSEAADQHRVLSMEAGAPEPGPWRTDRVPYLRAIQDSLSDPTCTRVVFVKSSQVGGSECGLNWALYTMLVDPAPMLVLFPSDESLKSWSTVKLDSMLRNCAALRGRVYDDTDGRRDKRNTIKRKTFPGGYLAGLTARSSSQLRSWTAPRGIVEEFEDYPPDVNNQGDPIELMERALRNFLRSGGKLFLVTTMSIAGFSRGEREFAASDQRHYHVPCPYCNGKQVLRWQSDAGEYRFIFDMDPSGESVIPGSTRYVCEHCDRPIEQTWRDRMIAPPDAEWIAHRPEITETRGFHIWTAYSPFVSWDQIATKFLSSRRVPEKLKTFVNTWLGQTWKESTDEIRSDALVRRVEAYGVREGGEIIEVPHGVGVLTAAIDVQGDRLEYGVWGFGEGEESWKIAWDRVEGDPGQDELYDRALTEVFRKWQHASGAGILPAVCFIDAGFMSSQVVRACDRWTRKGFRVIAIVGREGRGRPLVERPAAEKWKRSRAKTRPMHVVHTDSAKDLLLLSRIRVREPGPGYIHFPDSLDPVFFDQLTAEELRTVYVGTKTAKRPTRKWVLKPDRRNEALDLACYCLAALYELGPPVIARLGQLAQQWSEYRSPVLTTTTTREPAGGDASARPAFGYGMVSKGVDW